MPLAGKLGFWFISPAVAEFPNPGFEDGLINWQILNTRVLLNGGTTILGHPTPTDPTPNPISSVYGGLSSPGDIGSPNTENYTFSLVSDAPPGTGGTSALRLDSAASMNTGGVLLYGPAVISESRVVAQVGDSVEFDWKALSGPDAFVGDAYNVFAYMIEPSTGRTIIILDENASSLAFSTDWQRASRTIQEGEAGEYHFVFICGSFDATFGQVVGSSLLIDNVQIVKAI
jgi:hypothetical protein